ncbi:hypothetical protein V6N11_072263 [Hibiscus sabdariffa]|uniref:Uncharacterized protein n=1 Tax=Hibiscus sabdariffa TaxID=183260 RepID=A0ABR2U2T9_9ROSI
MLFFGFVGLYSMFLVLGLFSPLPWPLRSYSCFAPRFLPGWVQLLYTNSTGRPLDGGLMSDRGLSLDGGLLQDWAEDGKCITVGKASSSHLDLFEFPPVLERSASPTPIESQQFSKKGRMDSHGACW